MRPYALPLLTALLSATLLGPQCQAADTGPGLSFASPARSSDWISFTPYTNLGIYVPIKVNGHDALAWLWGGPTTIDTGFAQSLGLAAPAAADKPLGGLTIEAAGLSMRDAAARVEDTQAQAYSEIIGKPLVFKFGEELFDRVVVDLDLPRHRVAFRDPAASTKPAGAIELPLVKRAGQRVVPLSVNGGAPILVELELGNMTGPLLVTPAFARAQQLLENHPQSSRRSGPFVETVVSVDRLTFAGVDFPAAPIALIPDSEVPPDPIAGGVGLPLLSNFRLIIDYPHDRLFVIAKAGQKGSAMPKDRIGLVMVRQDEDVEVVFVAPHSPAEAAGFRIGDRITQIDGVPCSAWRRVDILKFSLADSGTKHSFTMADRTRREVQAVDFF